MVRHQFLPSLRKFPDSLEYEKVRPAIKEENSDIAADKDSEDSGTSRKERLVACFRKKKEFRKDEVYNVEYRISVMHRPTNANYWHCQIEIAPACEGGKTVSKEKAEWQKEALKALTNYLVGYASFHHKNPIPMVKKEWYMKHPA